MKGIKFIPLLLAVFLTFSCSQEEKKILLFGIENSKNKEEIASATKAFDAISDSMQVAAIMFDTTSIFTEDALKSFKAIVFLYTSGEILNDVQRADVERYAQSGGQVFGIEASPKVEMEWPWYGKHMNQTSSILDPISDDFQSIIGKTIEQTQLDYALAKTQRVPEENRFSKEVVDFNLNEPMELDEIKGKGIIFVERRGLLKLFDFSTEQTKQVGELPVAYMNEDGLLGIAVDPNFSDNNWLYMFYSAPGDEPIQHVSRFDFVDDTLDLSSEKVLLTIPTIRKCCHSGGALEFGPNGNLFITLGDNTNPFESSGYAPIDERPGRALWDAQKSAANSNDLRGKILRITPEDDGTYSIPEGNLFPEGTPKTRPEIYTMGLRNPFRPSIDSKTGYVYWGDVGPDAGKADSTRGPSGMGEFNQARKAGFYGWPYTRGNNQTYFDYDFAAAKSLNEFDPNNIINDSPNNTGIEKLPPVQESLIWYPYGMSEEFPWLGKGGINPMAGPVFHAEDYGKGFPEYFENKLFLYEWMRDWIYVVTLDENYDYVKADAFMPNTEFSHPMDMIFGQDGMFYILEYGQKWNSQNLDARLSRIRYIEGNRDPIARITVDKEVGSAPLTVNFSGEQSMDFDEDKLSYEWSFDEAKTQSTEQNPSFTFEKEGIYTVTLTVSDGAKAKSSITQKIMVGNETPEIVINTDASNIYWNGKTVDYTVEVNDKEDGNTSNGSIKAEDVKVTFTYLPEGEDIVLATIGHQQNTIPEGLKIMDASDCKACHARKEKVNGPSYEDIANKYTSKDKSKLIASVVKGSSGVWGETMMSAHPQLSIEEVGKVIDYVLSLRTSEEEVASLPLSGTVTLNEHDNEGSNGRYILMASYLDKGNPQIKESNLSISDQLIFKSPRLEAESADEMSEDLSSWSSQGSRVVGSIVDNTYLKFSDVNFTGLVSVRIGGIYNADYDYGGTVELRQGSVRGKLLGQSEVGYFHHKRNGKKTYDILVENIVGKEDLYLVFRNEDDKERYIMNADWVFLEYGKQ
jgi:cytochrome c